MVLLRQKALALLLVAALCFTAWAGLLYPAAASAQPIGTAAIGSGITDWILDEPNGYIYAITDNASNNLLFIRTSDLQVQKSLSIGSKPSDLELVEGKLYVALWGATQIKKVDIATQAEEQTFTTGGGRFPYRIAVDGDQIFYVEEDQWTNVYAVDTTTGTDAALDTTSYYEPDLQVDRTRHILLVGESGSSGSHTYTYDTVSSTKLPNKTTYNDGYGFSYPNRKIIADGDGVFYAGRQLQAAQLDRIRGDYTDGSYTAQIRYVHNDYVFTSDAVYDRSKYVRIANLPVTTDWILVDQSNQLYLFNASTNSVEKHAFPSLISLNGVFSHRDNKLVLDRTVTDMVYSEATGWLYAISQDTNKLLYIHPDTLTVEKEVFIGSKPTDIDLVNGKLYIALWGANQIASLDDSANPDAGNLQYLTVQANPYRLEADSTSIYYLPEYPGSGGRYLYQYNLANGTDQKVQYSDAPYRTFYRADLLLDPSDNKLYIGESQLSSSYLYKLEPDAGKLRVVPTTGASAGSSYPAFGFVKDGATLYYAKQKLDAANLLSVGATYSEPILYAKGNDLFSSTAVYDASGSKRFALPFAVKQVWIREDGSVLLYSETKKGIYRYDSVEDIKFPRAVAVQPAFKDTDPDEGQIGGALTWSKDEDEDYITGYHAYFMNSTTAVKGDAIGQTLKGSGPYSLTVTADTYIPEAADAIAIYSYNAYAESKLYASVPLQDWIVTHSGAGKLYLNGLEPGHALRAGDPILDFQTSKAGGQVLYLHFPDDNLEAKTGNQTYLAVNRLASSDFRLTRVSNQAVVPVSVVSVTYAAYGALELTFGSTLEAGELYRLSMSDTSGQDEIWMPSQASTTACAYAYVTSVQGGEKLYEQSFDSIVITPKPTAPQNVLAITGNGVVQLIWDANLKDDVTQYRIYMNGAAEPAASVTNTTYTFQGLTNGQAYSFEVTAVSKYGKESDRSASVTAVPTAGGRSGSGHSSNPSNGSTAISVTPGNISELLQALPNGKAGAAISIPSSFNEHGIAMVQFSGSDIAQAVQLRQDAFLSIETELAVYRLPLSLLPLNELANKLGTEVDQLKITVSMTQVGGDAAQLMNNAVQQLGASLLSPVMDYNVTISAGDQSIKLENFGNTYVTRTLVLNQSINPLQATAVMLDPSTGALSFVPAVFELKNGQWYVSMKRPGNSIYAVTEHKATFSDVKDHWGKEAIESLASKLVLNGMDSEHFAPEATVTRAQFASMLVRALGLTATKDNVSFTDVSSKDWYDHAVRIAASAGLVEGLEDGSFRPEQPINREEMMVMMYRAMKFTGYSMQTSDTEAASALSSFKDSQQVAAWAGEAAAALLKESVVSGVADQRMDPKAQATRAQSAAMLQRMMKKTALID